MAKQQGLDGMVDVNTYILLIYF